MPDALQSTPVNLEVQINNALAGVLAESTQSTILVSSAATKTQIHDMSGFPNTYLEAKLAGQGHPETESVNN